jgi:hypothetical protein
MKHVHCDIIKAWADGAKIQALHISGVWGDRSYPMWETDTKYRVKPPEPVIEYRYVTALNTESFTRWNTERLGSSNIKATFTDGKLTHVEIIQK